MIPGVQDMNMLSATVDGLITDAGEFFAASPGSTRADDINRASNPEGDTV